MIIEISAEKMREVLNVQMRVASVIKQRFPNLTVNEVNVLTSDIIQAMLAVTA